MVTECTMNQIVFEINIKRIQSTFYKPKSQQGIYLLKSLIDAVRRKNVDRLFLDFS